MRLYRTSVGAKAVMAGTGLMLFGFLIAHASGNLLVYKGRDALNSYAQGLKNLGPVLWGMRFGLLAVFLLHVATAIRLNAQNKEARPIPYQRVDTLKATWASRYMLLTGMVILAFVVYHLMHFTFHQFGMPGEMIETLADGTTRTDVYAMVVSGFQSPFITSCYLIAHALLLVHLLHGISSLFQSVGVNQKTVSPIIKKGLPVAAMLLVLVKVSIPISILIGLVGGDQ